ncbi:hypothetical protein F3Y22_tig00112349pilonHSYRG00154 [Hibiscus syriacus]|uniref:AIG1-type G domain-containing protein n=1 Tax=Hibiscus syriacus TaxID=106335 RepID=A0A6A2XZD8_HIBSY|nr:hypothetical protein F3Y22_tig00112349pilonHSYRG00154 [Hibiscus syriacus]
MLSSLGNKTSPSYRDGGHFVLIGDIGFSVESLIRLAWSYLRGGFESSLALIHCVFIYFEVSVVMRKKKVDAGLEKRREECSKSLRLKDEGSSGRREEALVSGDEATVHLLLWFLASLILGATSVLNPYYYRCYHNPIANIAPENPNVEWVESEYGDGHEIKENGYVMVGGPNHDSQHVVNSEFENGGLEDFGDEDEGSSLEGSQKDVLVEVPKSDEDVKPSADAIIAPENLGVERVESKYGNGHKIEEHGSVMVESIDKVVVSDMKESNDIDSVEVSAPISILDQSVKVGEEDIDTRVEEEGFVSEDDVVELIFGSSETTKQVVNEVDSDYQLGTESHQIVVDSDEEAEAEREHEAKELLDSAALAALLKVAARYEEAEAEREYEAKELLSSITLSALLKAAAGGGSDGVGLKIASSDGSRVFPLDHPAYSGSSVHSSKVAPPSNTVDNASKDKISDEYKRRFEKLQLTRVKFLRLVQRLGHSHTDPMVAQLEAEGKDDLDFSLNILVLGKTGVGKSASVNSILCEQKSRIDAFLPATTAVKEIVGTVDEVELRIFDTPGLRSPVTEEASSRKLLASIKRFVKKFPPNVVLYVDRVGEIGLFLTRT